METQDSINIYGELLRDDAEESSENPLNISSYITSIKDFISANITSEVMDDNYCHSSSASRSSNASEHSQVCDPDILTSIHNKLTDLEVLIHEEKNFNLINEIKIETEIYKIKGEFKDLSDDINYIYDKLYKIDKRVIETEQYPRRHNLVITGIPDSIKQYDLEKKVIEVLYNIGASVSHYDVIGCHRLFKPANAKYPAKTIIRFTNRKVVEFCIRNQDRLLEIKNIIKMNLRFQENLCEANETVFKWCRDLKNNEILHDFFIRNGYIKIVVEQGDKPLKIKHPEELFEKFNSYFGDGELNFE